MSYGELYASIVSPPKKVQKLFLASIGTTQTAQKFSEPYITPNYQTKHPLFQKAIIKRKLVVMFFLHFLGRTQILIRLWSALLVEPTNFPCFKNTNLARLYGKRNARAGVMLADMSQLIVLALKTQNLLDFMVKQMPGQV